MSLRMNKGRHAKSGDRPRAKSIHAAYEGSRGECMEQLSLNRRSVALSLVATTAASWARIPICIPSDFEWNEAWIWALVQK